MSRHYLSRDEVLAIHEPALERFGGSYGILNEGALDSALNRPRSGYYENIYQEAGALLESLALNHAFVDGIKRVAFFATEIFLRKNGCRIVCDEEKANLFIRSIAENKTDRKTRIQTWIENHVKPLQ